MIGIDNRSRFPAELLSLPDTDAQEIPLLVMSSTWLHSEQGLWEPAPEPSPICFADEYVSEPAAYSSIKNEAQTATEKARVDVLVNGSAHAPNGKPSSVVTVELYAASIAKQVRVLGDRYNALLGPSLPEKFVTMPLIYERAFGGVDTSNADPNRHQVWKQNPAGLGFLNAKSHSKDIRTDYPNLESTKGKADALPAGFSAIARSWSPRLEYAGTFDDEWLNEQWPLLPRDFDIQHYQAAPRDQQAESLRTGDRVQLLNFTPEGVWDFLMPLTTIDAWLMCDTGKREVTLSTDTVLIEPDQRKVTMVYRHNLRQGNHRGRVREVVIGPATPGYLLAKERHKTYLNFEAPKTAVKDIL